MIKVNSEADKVCVAKAQEAGQAHLFENWDELTQDEQRKLIADLRSVNYQLVKRLLHQSRQAKSPEIDLGMLAAPEVEQLPETPAAVNGDGDCFKNARQALGEGKVALLLLAGGASLGASSEPTGMLPIGPISGKSLFQLHAEKIRAINHRYKTSLGFHIVIHPDYLEMTSEFFKEQNHFGLNPADVHFVPQALLPLIDRRGRFLRSREGRLALSPSGHGGVLDQYLDSEGLEKLREDGVEYIFFFQVDNPLVPVADPAFLEHHLEGGYEVSSKCIDRLEDEEGLGVFCRIGETTGVIKYSDLPEEERNGKPAHLIGNMAAHIFNLDFIARLHAEKLHLSFHQSEKTVEFIDQRGELVRPTEPNCFEFNCRIYDALWSAEKSCVVYADRAAEFSPIKQMGGESSSLSAQRDLSQLYAGWLERCGVEFTGKAGEVAPMVEISPLYALNEAELKSRSDLPGEVTDDILLTGAKT
ncbi:MAG: UTP--glucose-1-phosphate uridylyltransferase [Planctomycetota bacterium]|nr:UTP--glucose-1-phosphate uridylyltransferase [Planctomycetota bacterium]